MKKKSTIIVSVLILLGIAVFGIGYYILNRPDQDTTLTIVENKWIESNKNKLIDLSVINQVPILNYNGSGLVFEFLDSLEKDTGLEFNKVSISPFDTPKTEYAIMATTDAQKDDLLLYQDNYALVTRDTVKYNRLEDVKDLTVGVLNENLEMVNTYLRGSTVTFKTYQKVEDLIGALNKEKGSNDAVDAIVLPKTTYLEEIVSNDFTIAYNISEYQISYVFRLGKTERLNTILKKYYQKWFNENYEDTYQTYLASTYFDFKQVDDKEKVKFKSKRYVYGFVENAPYDIMVGSKLRGYNSSFLKLLSNLADIEISFQKYDSIAEMLKDFNANKIDIMLDSYESTTYDMDVFHTVSPYQEQFAVLSHNSKDYTIRSISSLQGKKVMAIKNSMIAFYLKANHIEVIEFNNIDELMKKVNKDSIVVIDYENYKYYKNTILKNFKVDYQENLSFEYSFIIRDIKDNKLFADLFNFYLSFANETSILNNSLYELLGAVKNPIETGQLLILVGTISMGIVIVFIYGKVSKRGKNKKKISKEDKLRYIDALTSLKNRAYLNANIEKWDESEVYPQAIIIVDLNNIAYINDNYGHQEGDNVIKEAANILIRGQIENSDIIRTNGNEFLIYLVGYDEKQVVAYNRKLNKELKELSHGFGAASGYSMITDAIKTIDDAVNEATLDMRNNKEELNN